MSDLPWWSFCPSRPTPCPGRLCRGEEKQRVRVEFDAGAAGCQGASGASAALRVGSRKLQSGRQEGLPHRKNLWWGRPSCLPMLEQTLKETAGCGFPSQVPPLVSERGT